MSTQSQDKGAYAHLLVLELGDEATQSTGRFFADMGATVIKVEPPSGAGARHRGPYRDDKRDINSSIYFWAHNTSKDSITLDLTTRQGKQKLKELAARADVVLEDYPPGYLEGLGLGYEHLSAGNPGLVVTSITPFGQSGPLKDWLSSDMVNLAMGGNQWNLGYDDPSVPPLVPQGDLSWQFGGIWASMGTLAALMAKGITGEGQHVDISIQEACAFVVHSYNTTGFEYQGVVQHRHDYIATVRTKDDRLIVPQILNVSAQNWLNLRNWLIERGVGEDLKGMDAPTLEKNMDKVRAAIQRAATTMTSRDLIEVGQGFGTTWAAVNTPDELMKNEQLIFRGFFENVEHPELGKSYLYGGQAALWSEAQPQIRHRPPLLGEHNAKWGVSK